MPFSGGELSQKGFPSGWDADAEDQASQRVFRVTQLLEAMVFRPFSWKRSDTLNSDGTVSKGSLNLSYAYHGGLIDSGGAWVLIPDGTVELTDGATNFIQRSDAGQVTVNQAGFTYLASIPMAQIAARNGAFVASTYIDRRPEIGGAPSGGGGGAISFPEILGFILDGQVPESAVTQHQAALILSFTQLFDTIADDQVPESAVTQHEAALSILFSQIVGFIDPTQVPLEAVLQYCEEIDACLGAFIPGWEGRLTDLVGFLIARADPTSSDELEDIDAGLGALIPGWGGDLTTIVGWLIARDREVTIKDNEVNITVSPAFATLADALLFLIGRATELPPPESQIASNFMFC